jgi:hypothetical protein
MQTYKCGIKFVKNNPFSFGSGVIIYEQRGNETFVGKVTFEKLEPGAPTPPDAINHLDDDAKQELMDQMYLEGIRPTREIDTVGAFKAQGAHLKDMQRLVFKEEE